MRRFVLAAAFCLILGGLFGLIAAGVEPSEAPARYRFVPPHEAPFDFKLRDQDGQERSIAAARGNVLAITFLFSTCHDLCPAEASLIGSAMERVGDGVLAYSISVDPASDTPERARAFIERRSLDPNTFKFLLGSREQLAPVWRAYGIAPVNASHEEAIAAAEATDKFLAAVDNRPPRRQYVAPEREAPTAAEDSYPDPADLSYRGRSRHRQGLDFEHSAYVMLIDKHGRQRVGIPFEQIDVAGLAADMAALLNEP
jgi:protein SCO1/2